jgi:hypothetical protein
LPYAGLFQVMDEGIVSGKDIKKALEPTCTLPAGQFNIRHPPYFFHLSTSHHVFKYKQALQKKNENHSISFLRRACIAYLYDRFSYD